jgi:hypothetical protein
MAVEGMAVECMAVEKMAVEWPWKESPCVCGNFAREIERWALFMGGTWPPKQGRGPVATKARHARRIRGKKVL